MNRDDVLHQIATHILNLNLNHPVRVGIDGVTAAGKSTFAFELAKLLASSGRPIVATTLDGFHNPRNRRYEKGRESAEGYYRDAYNYSAVVSDLLEPLGPGGTLRIRTQVFDLAQDAPIEDEPMQISPNSILVVDGSFSLRQELHKYWDVSIYLDVDFLISEDRASNRDAKIFGSEEKARSITRTRYQGAHKIHEIEARLAERANFVIRNDEPTSPQILAQRA
jgi:uridine kinase